MNHIDRIKPGRIYKRHHPSKIFENIVLGLIIVSSVTLVVDNPLNDPNGKAESGSTVPEPNTMLLFVSGLIGLVGFSWKFNKI